MVEVMQVLTAELDVPAEAWDGVVRVYDPEGKEQSWEWLEEWFGLVPDIRSVDPGDAAYVFRCVALRTKDAEATQVVYVQGLDGKPYETGVGVVRWWNSAPGLPDFPDGCLASRWEPLGVIGVTGGPEADVGFGMGTDDAPPGWSAVWVVHCDAPSDYVGLLGWAYGGTAHRVVRPVFRMMKAGEEPEPEPEPEDGDVVEALDRVTAELAGIREMMGQGWVISRGV